MNCFDPGWSDSVLVSCCGYFPSIETSDDKLNMQTAIDTTSESTKNVRIVSMLREDSDTLSFAVSSYGTSDIVVFDGPPTNCAISRFREHTRSAWGLDTYRSGPGSDWKIVSGGNGDGRMFLFDAVSGIKETEFMGGPRYNAVLVAVPEWNEVFTGGDTPPLVRFDVSRPKEGELLLETGPRQYASTIRGIGANIERNLVCFVGFGQNLCLWSRDVGKITAGARVSERAFSCCSCEPNLVLVGMERGCVEVWDLRKMNVQQHSFCPAEKLIFQIEQLDDDRFVSGSYDNSLAVWRVGQVLQVRTLPEAVVGVSVLRGDSESGLFCEERFRFLDVVSSWSLFVSSGSQVRCWKWIVAVVTNE